jgi:hypothetical protein
MIGSLTVVRRGVVDVDAAACWAVVVAPPVVADEAGGVCADAGACVVCSLGTVGATYGRSFGTVRRGNEATGVFTDGSATSGTGAVVPTSDFTTAV